MSWNELKDKLLEKIKNNDHLDTLDVLNRIAIGELLLSISMSMARYRAYQKDRDRGVLSDAEASLNFNQITFALLNTISGSTESDLKADPRRIRLRHAQPRARHHRRAA